MISTDRWPQAGQVMVDSNCMTSDYHHGVLCDKSQAGDAGGRGPGLIARKIVLDSVTLLQ